MQLRARRPVRHVATLVALACSLAAAPAAAANAPHCTEAVTFLGFSRNERTLALRTTAACHGVDGSVDNLQLVKLVDVADGRTLATYEEAPSWRTARGRRHLVGRATLAAAFPSLAHVQSPAAWSRVRAAGAFVAHRHDFADASVRLRLDASRGGNPALQLRAEHRCLLVQARPGAEVRFTVVARLADGQHAELGHFVRPAGLRSPAALSVYTSRPGHRVALVWRVGAHTRLVTYSTPDDARFATNDDVGAVNVLSGTAEEVESIYKTLHPHAARAWDENVGELY